MDPPVRTTSLFKALNLNFAVFKQPRGFIKLIEVLIAIVAFATTTSHTSYTEFNILCPNGKTITQQLAFSYPYRLKETSFEQPFCNSTAIKEKVSPCCNFNSPAEFYVFLGVITFLYCLGAMVVYVVFDAAYRRYDKIPAAGFIVSSVFVVIWLISSVAWAQGVNDIKYYIDPNVLFIYTIPECHVDSGHAKCKVTNTGNFTLLTVSLIFGFLNTFMWAGNLWFLFKETKWHHDETPSSVPMTPQPSNVGASANNNKLDDIGDITKNIGLNKF